MKRTILTIAVAAGLVLGGAAAGEATVTHQSSSYCKKADHGKTGVDKAGKKVKCVTYTAWHWKHV